ncbi:MAG: hypothetical protein QOE45_1931 [Frankiaceae bacterium]|jgi:hypothetical protein|nr:hypothetical protein [Frankiaceae bacterium]
MTDLATVRGPRRPAPADGLDRALSAGRTRLRHRRVASTAATVSFAVVTGAALAAGPGLPGGHAGLDPAGDPRTGTAPSAAPASSGAVALPPTPLPTPPGVPPLPTASDQPPPPPSESPAAQPTRAPEPPAYLGTGSRAVTVTTRNDPAACADPAMAEPVARTGFCTAMAGPRALRRGTVARYAFTLCRAAGQAPKTLTFSTTEIRLFANRDGTGTAWSLDDAAPKHAVSLAGGDCRTWAFEWMGQDAAGYGVAAGSYEVLGDVPADEWTGENGQDTPPPPASVFVDVE